MEVWRCSNFPRLAIWHFWGRPFDSLDFGSAHLIIGDNSQRGEKTNNSDKSRPFNQIWKPIGIPLVVRVVVGIIRELGGEEEYKEDQGNDKGTSDNRTIRDTEIVRQPELAKSSRHRNRERH
jgi:hypothetical protein